MGGALLKAWAANTNHEFTVADPADPPLPDNVAQVGSVDELGDAMFDYLIVALKPQLIDTVLPDYLPHLSASGVISSIAAGYSAEKLAAHAPGRSVIRIMPNLPAFIRKGVSGLYAHGSVTETASQDIEQLALCSGEIVWVDSEDMLDRLTAVAGSGPGPWFWGPSRARWKWPSSPTSRWRNCATMSPARAERRLRDSMPSMATENIQT